ncbi:hypothetical protein A4S06_10055 [Erysipelotrichaceae bacterium MTC7]|nr:hypothetical protein A4S06_10055 [Erysipelotrichaceae bacterium MTC7]
MYTVVKALNHSAVLARTQQNEEVILLGKGIGFGLSPEQKLANVDKKVKCYYLENTNGSIHEIINDTDPVFLEITNEIITEAEKVFNSFDSNILLPLADHIAFSIERIKNDTSINNPLTDDIKLLFKDEYAVASKARQIIKDKIGFTISDDEIGYISLHIHCGLTNEKPIQSMQLTQIVHKTLSTVEQAYDIAIDVDSISYMRLLNHIKFLLVRLERNENVMVSINDFSAQSFPEAFALSDEICTYISSLLRTEISEEERGYLALHIEKVRVSHEV